MQTTEHDKITTLARETTEQNIKLTTGSEIEWPTAIGKKSTEAAMVSEVVEPVTTQSPPITQGSLDGCQDLNGQWSSKHTSERLTLNHNEDDSVDGLYNSCANCGCLVVEGRKATRESTLGLVVIGEGGDVVISWAGIVT